MMKNLTPAPTPKNIGGGVLQNHYREGRQGAGLIGPRAVPPGSPMLSKGGPRRLNPSDLTDWRAD